MKPVQVIHRLRLIAVRSASNVATSAPDVKQPPQRRRLRMISTLNPLSIKPSDYLDLSPAVRIYPFLIGFSNAALSSGPRYPDFRYHLQKRFPKGSTGFLYYHREPEAAPLEGGVRFRILPDATPSSFSNGQDLLLPTGIPWQIILPQLARPHYQCFTNHLLHENLVTSTQILRCGEIFGARRIAPSLILFRLGQEFPVNFASPILKLTVVDESLHTLTIGSIFGNNNTLSPFSGSAIARFEPSFLDGRRVVHLRITKIVTPVVCRIPESKIVEPKEGQLFTVAPWGRGPRPWVYDLTRKTKVAAVFRHLWATSQKSSP
ncbi:hypothetical protein C8F04DRAFT_1390762 [Mycena alexandri]|uniref:Uncharacterized protein n=1 Tax=Mycena alexandri TaxID=1745969 RepID=A0AAD6TB96_9AGAR|nr:hypothetical protein C8F04DRAFT_1390762 [Mycena alexandri]